MLLRARSTVMANAKATSPMSDSSASWSAETTTVYFVLRARRLHWTRQSSWRNWLVIFVVYVLVMVMAGMLQRHFRCAWTMAALLSAIPFFVTALVIRSREERDVAP